MKATRLVERLSVAVVGKGQHFGRTFFFLNRANTGNIIV